jgi:hypothetical protein
MIFYGVLALIAFLATLRDPDLLWIGAWLLGGWAISNYLHATMPVTELVGPYSMIEFMVLYATSIAWGTHRRYWPLLIIGALNLVSIAVNIGFSRNFPPTGRQIYLWELTTNLCFAGQCLLATGVGIFDGFRVGRFNRLSDLWKRAVAAYAARSARKP